jgi:Cas7 group CRISPR-associated protein Csh2
MSNVLNRGTGLLLIEAINSNPNGDPDRESDPRTRQDGRGEISPVSFKRKLRDLVANKNGSIWQELSAEMALPANEFDIMERKDTLRDEVKKLSIDEILTRYWDVRVFGSTFLEEITEDANTFIKTGVAQFGLGVSLSPVRIERMTTTKVLPVEKNKSKGMAPLAFRIVSYGLYAMPFFINATAAQQTRCTKRDIALLLRLIPYAYTQSASYIRPQVNIRRAFYIEHNRARGTFSDFKMIDALTPVKRILDNTPAISWKDYDEEALAKSIASLNVALTEKAAPLTDLMDQI